MPRFDPMTPSSATDAPGLPHPDLVAAIPRLRRYARVLTGDATRADDLVQDTLARAWEKRRLWRTGSDLRAWLFTIMHNVHVNQLALARRDAANVSIDADPGNRGVAASGAREPARSRRAAGARRSRSAGFRRTSARCCCSPRSKSCATRKSPACCRCPIGTVMSRLSRARDKLRRLLAEPASALRVVK